MDGWMDGIKQSKWTKIKEPKYRGQYLLVSCISMRSTDVKRKTNLFPIHNSHRQTETRARV